MIVKALCNVYHGVTNELTCKEGDIFTVVNIVNNPECADFRAIGITPASGHWVQFKETGGMIHRAACFGVLDEMEKFELAIKLKRTKEAEATYLLPSKPLLHETPVPTSTKAQ